MIKLFTSNNCPQCVATKSALESEGLGFEEISLSTIDGASELIRACSVRGIDHRSIKSAPVMFAGDWVFSGAECIEAVELKEWLD